jgi:Arc/MetJ-type ribon-helix-helix transcriptional regulator
MTITLNPDQEAQIKPRVPSGDFASVEEAARQLIDEALAERALDESENLAGRSRMLTKPWPKWRAASRSPSRSTRPATRQGSRRSEPSGARHRRTVCGRHAALEHSSHSRLVKPVA